MKLKFSFTLLSMSVVRFPSSSLYVSPNSLSEVEACAAVFAVAGLGVGMQTDGTGL